MLVNTGGKDNPNLALWSLAVGGFLLYDAGNGKTVDWGVP
jgi:hypothetical protein